MAAYRQRSLGMQHSCNDFVNHIPLKKPSQEFHQEKDFPQPAFFARQLKKEYGIAWEVETSYPEASRRHSNTTSGFLFSAQADKDLDGMLRPVRRPSLRPSLSTSTISKSASDGTLLPLLQPKRRSSKGAGVLLPTLPPKGQDSDPRVKDPFECKWMEVDVLKTANGDQVLKEDFCMVFDIYQALDNGSALSNSRYRDTCKSEIGRRAMQVCQSFKMRWVRSGLSDPKSKCLMPSFEDFLKQVWPHLSQSEENVLLSWAVQRERQLYAVQRLASFKASASGTKKFSNTILPTSIFK
eukprot:gnl/MRDRNA2_/MRDRNA2_89814_c1_seq1.p1 gnl/MRDRNA2_/MRDRNA2_89814_c1~~gnl/MRDRNA2_/MRDRNA2_89814_c1_seq1.p1  ORF type:complete len:296 (+),score=54.28 gnl/MRDRNA2_/MRDRNA2_89814_c1_seq1:94-981(+)